MDYLINEVIDRHGDTHKLYLSLSKSGLKDYVDVRFYSTYSGSSNPEAEQTKWQTTLPRESYFSLMSSIKHFAGNDLFEN